MLLRLPLLSKAELYDGYFLLYRISIVISWFLSRLPILSRSCIWTLLFSLLLDFPHPVPSPLQQFDPPVIFFCSPPNPCSDLSSISSLLSCNTLRLEDFGCKLHSVTQLFNYNVFENTFKSAICQSHFVAD